MNWWQRLCVATAVSFFASLKDASPAVKKVAKPIALEILAYIKLAFAGDPEFQ